MIKLPLCNAMPYVYLVVSVHFKSDRIEFFKNLNQIQLLADGAFMNPFNITLICG